MEQGEFHLRDGLTFTRTEDGYVRIRKYSDSLKVKGELDFEIEVDPSSWASVVASVCAKGEDTHTYEDAFNLHMDK